MDLLAWLFLIGLPEETDKSFKMQMRLKWSVWSKMWLQKRDLNIWGEKSVSPGTDCVVHMFSFATAMYWYDLTETGILIRMPEDNVLKG